MVHQNSEHTGSQTHTHAVSLICGCDNFIFGATVIKIGNVFVWSIFPRKNIDDDSFANRPTVDKIQNSFPKTIVAH